MTIGPKILPERGIARYRSELFQMNNEQLEAELHNSFQPNHYLKAAMKEMNYRLWESNSMKIYIHKAVLPNKLSN